MKNIIAFPKLGLEFEIKNTFEVFGFDVHWYGLLIGLGLVLAVAFALTRCKRYGVTSENVFDFVLIGLPSAVVGARLFYVIGDPDCISGGLLGVIAIWNGGLSIFGGLTFAVLSCLIYLKKKNMNILKTLDLAAPSFMIGQIIGRWGNFVNAEVFGGETSLVWGMSINGAESVHPLFLYEGVWLFIAFIVLVIYSSRRRRNGEIFSYYLIWYGIGRMWMEALRNEEYVLRIFGLAFSQLLSGAVIILGIAMLLYIFIKKPKSAMDI